MTADLRAGRRRARTGGGGRTAGQIIPVEEIGQALDEILIRFVGRDPEFAVPRDWFHALAYFVRSRMADCWLDTSRLYHEPGTKIVYYLSMEFLLGRLLKTNLLNLGLEDEVRAALGERGVALDEIYEHEIDPGLGNGGLGRLAACFLDSLTTQRYLGYGYGIRYDGGMFHQKIENGWQVEEPHNWLRHGHPWEFPRLSVTYPVRFGGRLERVSDGEGGEEVRWAGAKTVIAVAYDQLVSGFGHDMVNNIRLWSAKSPQDFDLAYFNEGEHDEAVRDKNESEHLSRVLYPDDSHERGRELRLRQEYFLVSATLQNIVSRFLKSGRPLAELPDKAAIQLNDTHPALAVPEMMRLLVDEQGLAWDAAWEITRRVFSYTNHTLMPEALETWPVEMMERVLPRHLDIIFGINETALEELGAKGFTDPDAIRRISIIGEEGKRHVRMAHLAFLGSHKVNGVSALHTRIMRDVTFSDFDRLMPDLIVGKTNGITSRRWLLQANPRLASLVSSRIGTEWITDLEKLGKLESHTEDSGFRAAFKEVKRANKRRLAGLVKARLGTEVDPESLFDVHIKRIHEYKRQLLNILHVVSRYNRIRSGRTDGLVPRTVIFAGKAAPSYHMAKLIIKLINDVAQTVNADRAVTPWLRTVFVPNYDVTTAEDIIPAADLSEQISTAGTEASGTGNMKLALNGAVTIGTRDGATIEIAQAIGEDNMFFFGLNPDEIHALRVSGEYDPARLIAEEPELEETLAVIGSGYFSPDDKDRFRPIVESLTSGGDYYMVLADFAAYMRCQEAVDRLYANEDAWTRKAIASVARMGGFSADRTIRGYAEEIWHVTPIPLEPPAAEAA